MKERTQPVHRGEIRRIRHPHRDGLSDHEERKGKTLLRRGTREQRGVLEVDLVVAQVNEGALADRRLGNCRLGCTDQPKIHCGLRGSDLGLRPVPDGPIGILSTERALFGELCDDKVTFRTHAAPPCP